MRSIKLTDFEKIKGILEGKRLLGYMDLKKKEYPRGDWDNAVAIYLGYPEDVTCFVLHCENQDYSQYDKWEIDVVPEIERDIRYKAIGEKINEVKENDISDKEWRSGEDIVQFTINTDTKVLSFGHYWNDCHYPKSIWEVI